ncbi:hypothetical protein P7H42_04810 [Vagococcus lutrae]|uniref:lectin-like domain-containing protein n=1 Tax=Vagococcus lutrae TaxID=81947 RepID=UPI00289076EE|nr:hypothetical protein [Vagococcus lutrae]MDT2819090.1 hypothetical protein [Vagococcus lutrae]MDT2843953.1 hypothetical protein [Vagococcus lutrae]
MKGIIISFVLTLGLPTLMPALLTVSHNMDEYESSLERVEEKVSETQNQSVNVHVTVADNMQDSLLMKDTSFILNKKENERLEKDDFVPYLKLDCFNDWYCTDQENQEEMSFETLSNRMLTMDLYVTLSKKEQSQETVVSQSEEEQMETSVNHPAETTESSQDAADLALPTVPFIPRYLPTVPGDNQLLLPLSSVFAKPVAGENGTTQSDPPKVIDDKILQITANKQYQYGAIWSKKKINLTKDFRMRSYIYLGDQFMNAADGVTFTLHNDPNGQKAIGSHGSGLGAYSSGKDISRKYIANALSFEFDTHYNGDKNDGMDKNVNPNLDMGHVGFAIPSGKNHLEEPGHILVKYPKNDLSNTLWHQFDVTWSAKTQELKIALPDLKLSDSFGGNSTVKEIVYKISNPLETFKSNSVYWGFTASTGQNYAENAIVMSSIPNSISHQATVRKSETETFETSLNVAKGETLEIKDNIQLDDIDSRFSLNDYIEIDISGLDYQPNSLTIGGQKVPANDISQSNNKLRIKLNSVYSSVLVNTDKTELRMKAKVINEANDKADQVLKYRFIYFGEGVVSDSTDVTLTLPKRTYAYQQLAEIRHATDSNFTNTITAHEGSNVILKNTITALDNSLFKKGSIYFSGEGLNKSNMTIQLNDELYTGVITSVGNEYKIELTDEMVQKANTQKQLVIEVACELEKSVKEDKLIYTFSYEHDQFPKTASNTVEIMIDRYGGVTLNVPESFNFGEQKTTNKTKRYSSKIKGDLKVIDKRRPDSNNWCLQLREKQPLTNTNNANDLANLLEWHFDKTSTRQMINQEFATIMMSTGNWEPPSDEFGVELVVPVEKQLVGEYRGVLEWRLIDAPSS